MYQIMGSSLDRELPFFPQYKTEVRGHVIIWWFQKEFSQSYFNFKKIPVGSNACTLITVLLAAHIHYNEIKIMRDYYYNLPASMVYEFGRCILEGNKIHKKLRKSGILEHPNLTVPEAIEGCGFRLRFMIEWKSVLYTSELNDSLYDNLKKHIKEWYATPMYVKHPDLYIILIADQRSVIFVYQDDVDMISVLDSHQHCGYGAIIAQVPRVRLRALCYWFHYMTEECFEMNADCYELSFLYFIDRTTISVRESGTSNTSLQSQD